METIIFSKTSELRRAQAELEKKLGVSITIKGRKVEIEGEPIKEYEASLVLDAINFGFSAQKALLLKDEDMAFRKIPIKNFTRRKNLMDVKARIIGTKGQTLRTIKEISGCHLELRDNTVGIIGPTLSIEEATTALTNLIKGSKQANVYRYLEQINKTKKLEE